MAYQITFLPQKVSVNVESGTNLLDAAAQAGVMIESNCGGAGTCGKCRVQILSGQTAAPDKAELSALSTKEIEEGHRLACRMTVNDDLIIIAEQRKETILRKSNLKSFAGKFKLDGRIKKYFINLDKPSITDQRGDRERIMEALKKEGVDNIHPLLLGRLPHILKESGFSVTAVVRGNTLFWLEKGDTRERKYGVAFDLGTTTVVGMLLDLVSGDIIACSALTNPQNIFGSDVISRITYVITNPLSLELMKRSMRDCLNQIVEDIYKASGVTKEEVYDATVVGNTTMSHLFLGLDPAALSRAPFIPVFCTPLDIEARDLGIEINPLASVYVLPNIAGYVGSDTVGVMLATKIKYAKETTLAIDVGTNGEVILAKDNKVLTCSTAAGPAFEGASIKNGMRAASGAIESVEIKDGAVNLEIIDDAKAIGICGSGLIDAMAQLLLSGIVLENGKFIDPEKGHGKELPDSLLSRIRKGPDGREFVLVYGRDAGSVNDIVITQKDVRELQLAKAAIYAGIIIMLKEMGEDAGKINKVLLAGAFGNYIKKESALTIGLFPDLPLENVISVGNAAGDGAIMALLSDSERKEAENDAQITEHIELSVSADFQDEFIRAITFPEVIKK